MYREALATAAEAHGWAVYWYDRERCFATRQRFLAVKTRTLFCMRWVDRSWQAKHKLAAATALAATGLPVPPTTVDRCDEANGRHDRSAARGYG